MKKRIISVLLTGLIVIAATGIEPACAQETEAGNVLTEDDSRPVGIISAMNNEIDLLLKNANIDHIDQIGGMDFNIGELCGRDAAVPQPQCQR